MFNSNQPIRFLETILNDIDHLINFYIYFDRYDIILFLILSYNVYILNNILIMIVLYNKSINKCLIIDIIIL